MAIPSDPSLVVRVVSTVNRTRMFPAFVHDRWDRALSGERTILAIFGVPVRPVTAAMLFGFAPIPMRWEADQ